MSVAETVLPSVRGRRRQLTGAVLLSALIIGSLLIAAAGRLVFGWWHPSNAAIGAIVLAAVLLDASGRRPIDVGRQVPQAWGHRYGPIAAAARYGLRLGVGPATILTSWTWWSGWLVGSVSGRWAAGAGAVGFAGARFATMAAIAAGTPNGPAMAARMHRWQSHRRTVEVTGLLALSVGGAFGLFA